MEDVTAKKQLIDAIIQHLQTEFSNIEKAARAAHEAATNPESQAEDSHDTRGIEASYLAGAQAKRAEDLQKQIQLIQLLPVKDFTDRDAIGLGACVELSQKGQISFCFLVPQGGGVQLVVAGKKLQLITPQSPMGEELLGRKKGDSVEVESKLGIREYQVVGLT